MPTNAPAVSISDRILGPMGFRVEFNEYGDWWKDGDVMARGILRTEDSMYAAYVLLPWNVGQCAGREDVARSLLISEFLAGHYHDAFNGEEVPLEIIHGVTSMWRRDLPDRSPLYVV